jgi:tetratricopeptide (TPR) repeat protein
MKTRTFAPPSAGRIRPPFTVSLAGLVCSLICALSTKAHADSAKELPWASVMPGSELRPGPALPASPTAVKATTGPGDRPNPAAQAKALALYYKARRLEQEADDEAALAIYEEALALDPGHPHLSQRLTGLYTRLGRLNEALALLEKAVRQFPKDPGPLLTLARFLERNHNEAPEMKLRALRTAEEAVAKFPSSSDAVDHLVRLHLADQNREKAQAVIDQVLKSSSKEAFFWLNLVTPARNAYPLDDRDTYEKHFAIVSAGVEKALKLDGENPDLQEAAGDFFARNREPARALELYEKAAAQRPGDLRTRQKLGQLLRMADRNVEAISLFESLVRIDPGDTVSHKALISLFEKTDPAKSLTHRAELLRLQSGDPRDYTTTANELLKAQRVTEALTLVKRGIFFNPQSAQLLYLQSRVLSEKGDHTAALGSFVEAENLAREKQPKLLDSAFYYSWGSVAQRAGRL